MPGGLGQGRRHPLRRVVVRDRQHAHPPARRLAHQLGRRECAVGRRGVRVKVDPAQRHRALPPRSPAAMSTPAGSACRSRPRPSPRRAAPCRRTPPPRCRGGPRACPANCCRNRPAVIAPPHRPAVFLMSATWLLSRSRYSSISGSRQRCSPARSPAWMTRAGARRRRPSRPRCSEPSAIEHAPVSVAKSTISSGLISSRIADRVGQGQPALGVGVVDLDRGAVHRPQDVARLERRPGRMLSVAATAVDLDRGASRGSAFDAEHGGGAGHVDLHPAIASAASGRGPPSRT